MLGKVITSSSGCSFGDGVVGLFAGACLISPKP